MNTFDKVVHDFQHDTIDLDTIGYLYDVVQKVPCTSHDPVFARMYRSFCRYKSFVDHVFERDSFGHLRFRADVPHDLPHAIDVARTYAPMVKLLRDYSAFIVFRTTIVLCINK